MERILTVGQHRLLFHALSDGLFVKIQNKLANGKTAYKTCDYTKKKWCFFALKSISLQSFPIGWSRFVSKRNFIYSRDGVSQFQKLLNFSSALHYSTQPKPYQEVGNRAKDYKDLSHSMEHCDSVTKPWSMHRSPVTEHPRVAGKDVSDLEREPVTSDSTDAGATKLPDDAVSCASDLSKNTDDAVDSSEGKKPGIFKRFHQTYKQYGKVLIGVHIFTSSAWTGLFYVIAMSGVNVEPFLRWVGAGDTIISFYTMPGVGHLAVAYLMYKLATPARYAATIGGTHMAVKWLTQWGYMRPIPESDNIKSLVKDGKTKVKAKYEKYQDKIDDIRDELKEFTVKENKTK